MATADNRRSPFESDGAAEKLSKKPLWPVMDFLKHQVLQCFGRLERTFANSWVKNSTGVSDQGGNSASNSELEQMWKQMSFTRSKRQWLRRLFHSRSSEESPCDYADVKRDGAKVSPLSSTMEKLPDELLSYIFIRLLAKQVAQMRCVSKSWNALLSHPSFIKSHLDRSVQINDQILLVFHKGFPFGSKPITTLPSQLTTCIKLPAVNPESVDTSAKVIGSVNGLICLCYDNDVIHIWNPSLSAVLTLPPTSLPFPIVACGRDSIKFFFHFGFDPTTDDYKVVKITGLTHKIRHYTHLVDEWLPVEVYSMRKGSWEVITQRFPPHIFAIRRLEHTRVCGLDGHIHWVGCSRETKREVVVACDLGSLTLRELSLPVSIDTYHNIHIVGVLAGKFCVISSFRRHPCEVWVMDEYGAAESWVKRHVFSEFSRGACMFGFTSRGEYLFRADDFPLASYHPIAQQYKIFGEVDRSVEYVVEYVDSLVWVAPTDIKLEESSSLDGWWSKRLQTSYLLQFFSSSFTNYHIY